MYVLFSPSLSPLLQQFQWLEVHRSSALGNVQISHAMPFLHPSFPVKTTPNGSNHTSAFTAAVRTEEAHLEAMRSALGLAGVGGRVLLDGKFQV